MGEALGISHGAVDVILELSGGQMALSGHLRQQLLTNIMVRSSADLSSDTGLIIVLVEEDQSRMAFSQLLFHEPLLGEALDNFIPLVHL